jgi:hypothetical protein
MCVSIAEFNRILTLFTFIPLATELPVVALMIDMLGAADELERTDEMTDAMD